MSLFFGILSMGEAEPPSAPVSFTLADSGEPSANGSYPVSGTENGRPRYELDANHEIIWDGSIWILQSVNVDTWYTGGSGTYPAEGVWTVEGGGSPAPIVTAVY